MEKEIFSTYYFDFKQLLYKYCCPPLSFAEIPNQIKEKVDFIVNPKFETRNKKPSAIIKLGLDGKIKIIRK